MQQGKDAWHEQQRREGCHEQAADHRAPEWRILSVGHGHRQHADHHRERRHQYRPQPRVTGCHGSADRIPVCGQLVAGKGQRSQLQLLAMRLRSRMAFLQQPTALHIFVVTLRCEHHARIVRYPEGAWIAIVLT